MSTMFSSVEEAKQTVATMGGVDPATFEEVPDLKVAGFDAMLLDDPEISEGMKQQIRNRLAAQKGFKFVDGEGQEVQIVIGPFRSGFDCWIVAPGGQAMRM